MTDLETQANFAIQKGKRDTDRLTEDCLVGLQHLLHGKYVQVDGKLCEVKVLSVPKEVNGEWRFMFDILNPSKAYDHIEFTLTKTGWGGGLTE